MLSFASGVMIAAAVWSLLLPSIEMAERQGVAEWFPAAGGFVLGNLFLLLLDRVLPPMQGKCVCSNNDKEKPPVYKDISKENAMLTFAVTMHNIPEGMAVGVAFASTLYGEGSVTAAITLAIGIAVQNIPEGAIISMPIKSEGISRCKAFLTGAASGIVEPLAAALTLLLTGVVVVALPYLLAFAAGAMIYVVVNELIPPAHQEGQKKVVTIGVTIGFVLMMLLDIALG